MSTPPKISVVLTCYNLGRYLDEAVDSVLAQTCQDFEIVVVNDGSTDRETIQLLTDYRRPKTRVVHIENRGPSGARNEGIRQTTGAYVCTLDADDRLERTYFEKAVAILDGDPSIAFVSHWLRMFGDEEREWKPESPDFPALLDRNSINGAALVRRDALRAVGFFDEAMREGCEDWDLWIGVVEHGLRGIILPEVLFFYRRRSDSRSRIMLRGETHVNLYRYMIEKHRASFATHLVELLVRREVEAATVRREAHDLELDCETVFTPEVDRLRDGLRVTQRKLDRLRARQETATELSRQAHLLADKDAEVARQIQTMTEMDRELAHRAQVMTDMDRELTHRAEVMTDMNTALARCNQTMTEMDAELSHRAEVITEMNAELARCGPLMTEMDAELARRQKTIGEHAAELERRARAVADRDAELTARHQTAEDLKAELSRHRQETNRLLDEMHVLRASLSWRLTRPLRAVYSWLLDRRPNA